MLAEADVFVSTASHEFFGIAAAEAIAVGLHPLFPNDLAYPEMIQRLLTNDDASLAESMLSKSNFLYAVGDNSATELANRLASLAKRQMNAPHAISATIQTAFLDQLVWTTRARLMDQRLADLI